MKENPSASMEQIGVLCSIILGAKSKELVAAESENLTRKEGESVSSFSMRVKEAKTRELLANADNPEDILNHLEAKQS